MRIEILGYFGSGKTFLANKLAESLLFEVALESHLNVPNWNANTLSGLAPSLSYELSFLLQHNQLLKNIIFSKKIVCDWSFVTDRIWARERLKQQDFVSFEDVYLQLMNDYVDSHVIYIYLDVSPTVILERLMSRGRKEESILGMRQIEKSLMQLKETIRSYNINNIIHLEDDYSVNDVIKVLNEKIKGS